MIIKFRSAGNKFPEMSFVVWEGQPKWMQGMNMNDGEKVKRMYWIGRRAVSRRRRTSVQGYIDERNVVRVVSDCRTLWDV